MPKPNEYVVGIDIGSSKVGVLIGQPDEQGGVEVVGRGLATNRGTRKGNIVNVEATVEALKQATDEAEVMAGVEISQAYVGVAGSDIRSVNSRGMVSVARKDREISRQDINRVLEAAQSAALPSDREVLHAFGAPEPRPVVAKSSPTLSVLQYLIYEPSYRADPWRIVKKGPPSFALADREVLTLLGHHLSRVASAAEGTTA